MGDQFEMVSNEPTLPWREPSAGGGYTTAADLMRLAGALMSNKLLKAETLAEATRPQFTTGAYGFGFQLGRPDEARTYGHGGGAPGMNAILRVYPKGLPSYQPSLSRRSSERMGHSLRAIKIQSRRDKIIQTRVATVPRFPSLSMICPDLLYF